MKKRLHAFTAIIALLLLTTIYSCTKESTTNSASNTGKGGSESRFTIAGNYLYAVTNHYLYAYDLGKPDNPELVYTSPLNFDIETIYPYNRYLFLGTKTGVYVYSIDTASSPRLIGVSQHGRSCDPVVVNDTVAFVTLKSTGNCGPATPGLYIHNIEDVTNPVLKTTIPLQDPAGLGLQDSILYVCCGSAGMKIFNVKKPYTPVLIGTKTDDNYFDVIPYNGILICSVKSGIILYNISDPSMPVLLKQLNN